MAHDADMDDLAEQGGSFECGSEGGVLQVEKMVRAVSVSVGD